MNSKISYKNKQTPNSLPTMLPGMDLLIHSVTFESPRNKTNPATPTSPTIPTAPGMGLPTHSSTLTKMGLLTHFSNFSNFPYLPTQPKNPSLKQIILTSIFLIYFIITSLLLLSHRFNHEISEFFDNDQEISALELKTTPNHKPHKHSDCQLCLLSILQSQSITSNFATLVLCSFFLAIRFCNNQEIKRHFTLRSTARSPPYSL